MLHRIFLALGSNLGDRLVNLERAIDKLEPQVHITDVSSVYETEPWGVLDQPRFLNCVIAGKTSLTPEELLGKLKSIETDMGRQPGIRYGPRLIDLDILLYGDLVLTTDQLTIPHPRMLERSFVLIPLAEIAGRLKHPLTGKTFNSLSTATSHDDIILYDPKGEGDHNE
jgi:2-amino-4-hydroxy-6-hydroxymethyldihydropteridine diphosphokinase